MYVVRPFSMLLRSKNVYFGTDLFCYKKLFEFAFMFCGHFSSGSGLKSRIESELKLDNKSTPKCFLKGLKSNRF